MNNNQLTLGDRMKSYYEDRYRFYLTRRTPVIIRIDGRAFHTFTKGLNRPYDLNFMQIMNSVTKYLMKNISGCKIGYVESDEISLFLEDYYNLNTDSWFEYNIQKVCSIAASMATQQFIKELYELNNNITYSIWQEKMELPINFDARAFNIPKEDVVNYFIWRQNDSTRNAILSTGQSEFGKKNIFNKKCPEIIDMLKEKGKDYWEIIPATYHYGRLYIYDNNETTVPIAVSKKIEGELKETLEKIVIGPTVSSKEEEK